MTHQSSTRSRPSVKKVSRARSKSVHNGQSKYNVCSLSCQNISFLPFSPARGMHQLLPGWLPYFQLSSSTRHATYQKPPRPASAVTAVAEHWLTTQFERGAKVWSLAESPKAETTVPKLDWSLQLKEGELVSEWERGTKRRGNGCVVRVEGMPDIDLDKIPKTFKVALNPFWDSSQFLRRKKKSINVEPTPGKPKNWVRSSIIRGGSGFTLQDTAQLLSLIWTLQ